MRKRIYTLALVQLFCVVASLDAAPPQKRHARKPTRAVKPAPVTLPCGDFSGFQVLLDRQGFSPGQIDGKQGNNLLHAIAAMQSARKLPPTGQPDCEAWHQLGGDKSGDLIATYTITEDDAKGLLEEQIPRELVEQAKLPSLGYRSVAERLGEKFHVSPALLQQMNAGVSLSAGATIKVPAVQPFDSSAKPPNNGAAGDVTLIVTKADSALRVLGADGAVIFFAPVTTGSEHDPLPTGDWKVTSVQWHPAFHYNPKLFWDAKPNDSAATIKPGPNNPVGVVWIDLSLEHYGIHGTPEPGNIGHTESHGCVRLTNWDAARVASAVKPGTPVQFR